MNYDDFKELYDARRTQFVNNEITEDTYARFLARNGFNATAIDSEINDAIDDRSCGRGVIVSRHPQVCGVYS